MPCVYVLYSKSPKRFYTGSTREDNSKKRFSAHNQSKTRSTKSGIPWQLVFEEKCETYTSARKRENFLKSGVGRQWLKEKFGYLK